LLSFRQAVVVVVVIVVVVARVVAAVTAFSRQYGSKKKTVWSKMGPLPMPPESSLFFQRDDFSLVVTTAAVQ
jgi:hypothetical protein